MLCLKRSGCRNRASSVAKLLLAVQRLQQGKESSAQLSKASQDARKYITAIKSFFLSCLKQNQKSQKLVKELTEEICDSHVIGPTLDNFHFLDFESKRDFTFLLTHLLRLIWTRHTIISYLRTNIQVVLFLVKGYEKAEITWFGEIVREVIRYDQLALRVLYSMEFFKLFDYALSSDFKIVSEAFITLEDLCTRHRASCAFFLEAKYEEIFTRFLELFSCGNCVTKKLSLKLVGRILMAKENSLIATRFMNEVRSLKVIMLLFLDSNVGVQQDAIQLFKFFFINPDALSKPVTNAIVRNREKLLNYLISFNSEKEEKLFLHGKEILIEQIRRLQAK